MAIAWALEIDRMLLERRKRQNCVEECIVRARREIRAAWGVGRICEELAVDCVVTMYYLLRPNARGQEPRCLEAGETVDVKQPGTWSTSDSSARR